MYPKKCFPNFFSRFLASEILRTVCVLEKSHFHPNRWRYRVFPTAVRNFFGHFRILRVKKHKVVSQIWKGPTFIWRSQNRLFCINPVVRRTIKNYYFDSEVNPSQNSAYNQSKAYKKRIFFSKKKFKISCGEGVVEAVEDSVVFYTFLSAIFQDGGKDRKCASHSIQYFILNILRPRRSKSVEKWECETKKTKKTIFRWKKVPKTTPPHNSIGEGDGSKRTWGN